MFLGIINYSEELFRLPIEPECLPDEKLAYMIVSPLLRPWLSCNGSLFLGRVVTYFCYTALLLIEEGGFLKVSMLRIDD